MFIINPYIFATGGGFTGLLDTYTGATVAYSVRRLNSAYTGALIRVRRSSDNAETDVNPDASNTISLTSTVSAGGTFGTWIGSDSGYIAKWYDQSGNANDAVRPTAAPQPRIVNAGSLEVDPNNGIVAIRFDGTDDSLAMTPISVTQNYYQHFVFNRASSGIHSNALSGGSTPYPFLWFNNNTTYSGTTTTTAHDTTQTQTGDFIQTTLRDSSNNVKFWENGTAKTTKTNTGTTGSYNSLGNRGGNYHNGYMQELIYWNSDQEANQSGIESNANSYFSVF